MTFTPPFHRNRITCSSANQRIFSLSLRSGERVWGEGEFQRAFKALLSPALSSVAGGEGEKTPRFAAHCGERWVLAVDLVGLILIPNWIKVAPRHLVRVSGKA
jgi:hypothetical protein